MAVRFNVRDVVSAQEEAALRTALGVAAGTNIDAAMTNLAKAALREFTDAILGKYLARIGSDINERRLLHLIHFHFGDRIPAEPQLAQLLSITETNATTMLKNLSGRQQQVLAPAYAATLQGMFDAKVANVDNAAHHVTIPSKHMVEWLRARASRLAPAFGPIAKVPGTNDRYAIPIDTYNAICVGLGLTA